ncbi:MAG: hypothetical protein NTZ83_06785 [Candidatus Pacearchaeota archaeon]|nr:hypothetical protein [Candidatus Pacearchaeota archaeon]
MAGLLTHLIASFVGFAIIYIFFKSWKYSLAFVLGHLMPDIISFGITGIRQGSSNPGIIMTNSWFAPLAAFAHNPFTWIILVTIVWVGALLLYSFKKMSKKAFLDTILVIILFVIGTTMHLIFDKLIIETSYWV